MIAARLRALFHHVAHHAARRTAFALTSLLIAMLAAPAFAQEPVSTDLYRERPRNEGNRIVFCLRPLGALAEFEAELADTIGQVLMTEVRTYTVGAANFPVRPTGYDYLFGLAYEQIFILMAERCDVLLGMYLRRGSPEWLRLSRPYISARVLAVSAEPSLNRFADLKAGTRIGVQALASGDAALTSYTGAMAEDKAPQRVIFRDNRSLVRALMERRVDVALIWEGALMAETQGDLEGAGLHIIDDVPFSIDPIGISAAVRTGDDFLGAKIDEALDVLEADGTLAEMAVRHKIALPPLP